jgi:hypothetical protein
VKEKLALQAETFPNLFVSALYNLIFISDDITTFLDDIISWNDRARYMGVGAGFTYKTPVVPVSIFLGSRTDTWNPIWYTNIGFTFWILNNSGVRILSLVAVKVDIPLRERNRDTGSVKLLFHVFGNIKEETPVVF